MMVAVEFSPRTGSIVVTRRGATVETRPLDSGDLSPQLSRNASRPKFEAGGKAPANGRSAWPRPLGGFGQRRRLGAPLQKREQAPALHTLARAASSSAAGHAKRLH